MAPFENLVSNLTLGKVLVVDTETKAFPGVQTNVNHKQCSVVDFSVPNTMGLERCLLSLS